MSREQQAVTWWRRYGVGVLIQGMQMMWQPWLAATWGPAVMGQRGALQGAIGLLLGLTTLGYEQAIPIASSSMARTLSAFCLLMSIIVGLVVIISGGWSQGLWMGIGVVVACWRRVAYTWMLRLGQEHRLLQGRWSSFCFKTTLEAAAQPLEARSLLWAALVCTPGVASACWSKLAWRQLMARRSSWAPLGESLRHYADCPRAVWPMQWLDGWHHQAPVVLAAALAPPEQAGHLALALLPVGVLFSVWGEPLHQHFYLRWLQLPPQHLKQRQQLLRDTFGRAAIGATALAGGVAGLAMLISPFLGPVWREAGPLTAMLAGLFPGNLLIHLSWHCRLSLGSWPEALRLAVGRSMAQVLFLIPALVYAYPCWLLGGGLVLINSLAAAFMVRQTRRLVMVSSN